MVSVKKEIISALKNILGEFTSENIDFLVEKPENENFGDYSSNIALAMFSNSKFKIQNSKFRTPMELAEKIASSCQRSASSSIDKVEAVAPGFINFHLSQDYLFSQLKEILEQKEEVGC